VIVVTTIPDDIVPTGSEPPIYEFPNASTSQVVDGQNHMLFGGKTESERGSVTFCL